MERRQYSRINVKIYGTIFKDNADIPIEITNISENGIGITYNYKHCPSNTHFNIGDKFTIQFMDTEENNITPFTPSVCLCEFVIVQLRLDTKSGYIGAQLTRDKSNYFEYVTQKKAVIFCKVLMRKRAEKTKQNH